MPQDKHNHNQHGFTFPIWATAFAIGMLAGIIPIAIEMSEAESRIERQQIKIETLQRELDRKEAQLEGALMNGQ